MRSMIFPVLLCSALMPVSGLATPWLSAEDVYLRDDIQQLADAGIITVPVTTYPLMWSGIGEDLNQTHLSDVSDRLQTPFLRVRHYYEKARKNEGLKHYKMSLANDVRRFPGFGDGADETAELESGAEWVSGRFAVKLNTQYSTDDDDSSYQQQRKLTADGSYAAMVVGNWVLRAGAVDQWWGPGWDNSLILSDNARPLPALSLTRNNSKAFETPWLNWVGPWTFTTQMAQLESSRVVPQAYLWGARGTFKPLPQLEIGASWTIMWGGEGQPSSISDFFKAVTGDTRCPLDTNPCEVSETKYGNQMAGFDVRWSGELLSQPLAFYAQTIGEDVTDYIKPADKGYIFGIETSLYWNEQRYKLIAEYNDTEVACTKGVETLNCYYEHFLTYESGHRYKGRALGSSFDNDSTGWTLGVLAQQANHHSWQAKVRILQLNTDNSDFHPDDPSLGHTVTKVAEDVLQLDLSYRLPLFKGMLTLGGDVSHSTIVETDKSREDVNVFASWHYIY